MAFDPDDIKAMLDAGDPINTTARRSADAALELLYGHQGEAGGHLAIAAALAVALAAIGFIREAAGDQAAEASAGMLLGAVAHRQDRVAPVGRTRQ